MEKTCINCKLEKNVELFVNKRNICKSCMKEYKKQHSLKNIEHLKEKRKKYYLENKNHILNKSAKYYEDNKEKKLEYQKKYSEDNKEKIAEYKSEYAKNNRKKINKYKSDYQNRRRKEDPIFMLKYSINRSINRSLRCKGLSKSKKTMDILGCSIEYFKKYLENMFIDNMSWENYGKVWDIDHKIPLITAESEEDVIKLNHYTNLQPLDSYINRNIKKDRLDFKL